MGSRERNLRGLGRGNFLGPRGPKKNRGHEKGRQRKTIKVKILRRSTSEGHLVGVKD